MSLTTEWWASEVLVHASTKVCGAQFALWGEWGAANPLVLLSMPDKKLFEIFGQKGLCSTNNQIMCFYWLKKQKKILELAIWTTLCLKICIFSEIFEIRNPVRAKNGIYFFLNFGNKYQNHLASCYAVLKERKMLRVCLAVKKFKFL